MIRLVGSLVEHLLEMGIEIPGDIVNEAEALGAIVKGVCHQ